MAGAENTRVGRHVMKRPSWAVDKLNGDSSHPRVPRGQYVWFNVAMALCLAGGIEGKCCQRKVRVNGSGGSISSRGDEGRRPTSVSLGHTKSAPVTSRAMVNTAVALALPPTRAKEGHCRSWGKLPVTAIGGTSSIAGRF